MECAVVSNGLSTTSLSFSTSTTSTSSKQWHQCVIGRLLHGQSIWYNESVFMIFLMGCVQSHAIPACTHLHFVERLLHVQSYSLITWQCFLFPMGCDHAKLACSCMHASQCCTVITCMYKAIQLIACMDKVFFSVGCGPHLKWHTAYPSIVHVFYYIFARVEGRLSQVLFLGLHG